MKTSITSQEINDEIEDDRCRETRFQTITSSSVQL